MEPEELELHTERMRKEARNVYACLIAFAEFLPGEHRDTFLRAITNVLNTEVALFTIAELIDGLPTISDCYNRRIPGIWGYHIINDTHEELCDGAMDKAREMVADFDPSILKFGPKAFREYLEATPGSKPFNLRLIELVAASLHQLGAEVSKLRLHLHKGDVDAVVNYTIPEIEQRPGYVQMEPRKTFFSHAWYLDDDVYPDGVAGMVGYWTEDRVLGGVAVFDRNPSTGDLPNVYWHSDREKVTYRLYQLLDTQQDALIAFFTSDPEQIPPSECPLLILGDSNNRVRVSAQHAITEHRIYRDEWERRAITVDQMRQWNGRPQSDLDYPETVDEPFRINAQLGIPLPEGSSYVGRGGPAAKPTQSRPRSPSPDVPPGFEIPTMTSPGPRTPSPDAPERSGVPMDRDGKTEAEGGKQNKERLS